MTIWMMKGQKLTLLKRATMIKVIKFKMIAKLKKWISHQGFRVIKMMIRKIKVGEIFRKSFLKGRGRPRSQLIRCTRTEGPRQ